MAIPRLRHGGARTEPPVAADALTSQIRTKEGPWLEFLEGLACSPLTPVLLVGPGGVGAARRLHRMTHRGVRVPFVHVDCTWLPEGDVARLLFGAENTTKIERGFVERANGGTLFLDDIDELPPADQARMVELLDRMRFRRVLGQVDVEVSLRVIAGLAGDEESALSSGRLCRELYARLRTLPEFDGMVRPCPE